RRRCRSVASCGHHLMNVAFRPVRCPASFARGHRPRGGAVTSTANVAGHALGGERSGGFAVLAPVGGQRLRDLRADAGSGLGFHRTVAADLEVELHDVRRLAHVRGRQRGEQGLDRLLELDDQLPLEAALGGMAEGVELRAAQPAQACEHAEHGEYPAAEFALARPPARVDAATDERRGEVEAELRAGTVFLPEPLEETARDVEPRDLVLVLVRERLEPGTRDRVGEGQGAPGGECRFRATRALHERAVAFREPAVRYSVRNATRLSITLSSGSCANEVSARRSRASTSSGCAAASRPQPNARRLFSISTPLSSIARSKASADTGTSPRCQA